VFCDNVFNKNSEFKIFTILYLLLFNSRYVFQISDNFDMHIIATSKIGDATLEQFGTVHMSAIPNERLGKDHYSDRAACIEYRCSGLIVNNGIYMDNISTVVDVNIVLLDKTVQCRMR